MIKLILIWLLLTIFIVNAGAVKAQRIINISVDIDQDPEEDSQEEQQTENGKITYEANVDELVSSQFKIELIARNPTDTDHEITAWSYIYRGSKCYSNEGEREANKKTINFPQYSNVTFHLENILVEDIEPGDYKLKIKILRNDRKTTDDITKDITVYLNRSLNQSNSMNSLNNLSNSIDPNSIDPEDGKESQERETTEEKPAKADNPEQSKKKTITSKPKPSDQDQTNESQSNDAIAYISKNAKRVKSLPYMLLGFLTILVIYFVAKKV